jgi:tetratricopeptide (TPR) repeat protein
MTWKKLSPWLLTLALAPSAAPPAELPKGTIVEEVRVEDHPGQSYAVYLPSGYQPDRRWPILYALDARGQGAAFAERFRAAAETWGVIVASSNNSASDGSMEPNFQSMRAMWADTRRRFSIDARRVYAAGFSGTVRAACTLAEIAPGTIHGVLGTGAGFPFDHPPGKDTAFAFFGAVGDRDFNYYEMMDLDAALGGLGLPHRIELFEGGHEWLPVDLAVEGLAWLELQRIKAGQREPDAAILDAVWKRGQERARAYEAAGRLFEAWRSYKALAADFQGLREIPDLLEKVAGLEASEVFARQRREREARMRRDQESLDRAKKALVAAVPGEGPVSLNRVLSEIRVPELKKRAGSADREESLSARRVLDTVLVQAGYYLPRDLLQRKDYDRALFYLSIATAIAPEDPGLWLRTAIVNASRGSRKKALEDLRKAVDLGWRDLSRLETEPAFASLHGEEGYRKLAAELRESGR